MRNDEIRCPNIYNVCMLGNFLYVFYLSFAEFFYSNFTFSISFFTNTIRVSNRLDPDKGQHFIGPDLGANCFQRLSADDT